MRISDWSSDVCSSDLRYNQSSRCPCRSRSCFYGGRASPAAQIAPQTSERNFVVQIIVEIRSAAARLFVFAAAETAIIIAALRAPTVIAASAAEVTTPSGSGTAFAAHKPPKFGLEPPHPTFSP